MDKEPSGNGQGSGGIDWEQVRRQLDMNTQQPGDGAYAVPQEVMDQIWAQRAAQFAEIPESEDQGQQIDLVVIRLGRELYGLEAQYIFRIRPATQIAYVPRVPAWITGIANERGRILSVLDLRSYLGLEEMEVDEEELATQRYLVVVETPEMELSLLADEVLDIQTLPISHVQQVTDTVRGIPKAYVYGLVPNVKDIHNGHNEGSALVILDLRALLSDEKLRIHEEIT